MSNYNTTLQSNNTDLQAILDAVNALPEAGAGEPTLQTKTVDPTTYSQTVAPDPGYDGLSQVTVSAIPTVTQATPSITLSNGIITAKSTQTAGYVVAGTKSATKELATKKGETITPTKSQQTAVGSGFYTLGAVYVAPIPSQYITTTDATATAADIRSGKTAYVNGSKVTGTMADFDGSYECSGDSTGGSSGGAAVETCTVNINVTRGGNPSERLYGYTCTAFVDGAYTPRYSQNILYGGGDDGTVFSNVTLTDVVCGSIITLSLEGDGQWWEFSTENIGILQYGSASSSVYPQLLIQAPAEPGVTATVHCEYTD